MRIRTVEALRDGELNYAEGWSGTLNDARHPIGAAYLYAYRTSPPAHHAAPRAPQHLLARLLARCIADAANPCVLFLQGSRPTFRVIQLAVGALPPVQVRVAPASAQPTPCASLRARAPVSCPLLPPSSGFVLTAPLCFLRCALASSQSSMVNHMTCSPSAAC